MSAKKFLLNIVRENPAIICLYLLLSWSSAILNCLSLVLVLPLIGNIFPLRLDSLIAQQPEFLQQFYLPLLSFSSEQQLGIIIPAIVGLITLKLTANYIIAVIGEVHSQYLADQLRFSSFSLLLEVSIDFYTRNDTSKIFNIVNQEIEHTEIAFNSGHRILNLITNIFVFVVFLLYVSWQLTLLSGILLIIMFLLEQNLLKYIYQLRDVLIVKTQDYRQQANKLLSKITLIKILNAEKQEYEQIVRTIHAKKKSKLKFNFISNFVSPLKELYNIIFIINLIVFSHVVLEAKNHNSIVLVYVLILFSLLNVLNQFRYTHIQLINNLTSAEKVRELLNQDDKILSESGNITFKQLESEILLHNLSFSYPDSDQLVLNQVNVLIPQGKIIAIVGAYNTGESAFIDLLARFYEPTGGHIFIDGQDIQEYDLKSLRQAIGIIQKDTDLFADSIYYNLTYGLSNVTKNEIITATQKAGIYEFITQLPQGLDTKIDHNLDLSLEKKQRIAIARTWLRNPSILILDEPTGAFNHVGEQAILPAIQELSRDRTTIIITRRIATIKHADKIIVLDKGHVLEEGTHQELIKNSLLYSRFHSLQLKGQPELQRVEQLTQKIAAKLYNQSNTKIPTQIYNNLNYLLASLELVIDEKNNQDLEPEKILDESNQTAKQIIKMLKIYQQKLNDRYK